MTLTKEQILAEAKALDPRDRRELAEALLDSIIRPDGEAIDAAWLAEARCREEAFARGEMSSAPVEETIARIGNRIQRSE